MLKLIVKNGDQIKIGDEIIIKSMTDGRVSLAVDAPRELKIERLEAGRQGVKKSITGAGVR